MSPTPTTKSTTIQNPLVRFAGEIGWICILRAEPEKRHGLTKGWFSNPLLSKGGQECPPSVHVLDLPELEADTAE